MTGLQLMEAISEIVLGLLFIARIISVIKWW